MKKISVFSISFYCKFYLSPLRGKYASKAGKGALLKCFILSPPTALQATSPARGAEKHFFNYTLLIANLFYLIKTNASHFIADALRKPSDS